MEGYTMTVKEYIKTHQGLWNILGGITYEIDKENKCVNILDGKTFLHYRWCEDNPNVMNIVDTIKKTRKNHKFRKEIVDV